MSAVYFMYKSRAFKVEPVYQLEKANNGQIQDHKYNNDK